jgi:hypothetical protein
MFAVKEARGARLHVFSALLESLSLCETQPAQQIVQRKYRQPSAVGGSIPRAQQRRQFRQCASLSAAKISSRDVDSSLASVTNSSSRSLKYQAQAMAELAHERFQPSHDRAGRSFPTKGAALMKPDHQSEVRDPNNGYRPAGVNFDRGKSERLADATNKIILGAGPGEYSTAIAAPRFAQIVGEPRRRRGVRDCVLRARLLPEEVSDLIGDFLQSARELDHPGGGIALACARFG